MTVVVIVGLTVMALTTTGWHGHDTALIAVSAALVATLKRLTGIDLRTAFTKVEWSLILFLAARMMQNEALLDSCVGKQLAATVASLGGSAKSGPIAIVAPVATFMHSDHHPLLPGELICLSLALLPMMFGLLVLFGIWV